METGQCCYENAGGVKAKREHLEFTKLCGREPDDRLLPASSLLRLPRGSFGKGQSEFASQLMEGVP